MECVEAALKTSIRKEMAVKANGPQAVVFDDFLWGGAVVNGQNACDDFSVDDLLDFSNEDGFFETEGEEEDDKEKVKASVSVSPQKQNQETEKSNLSEKIEPASELSVPADDLVNLEWLSHFVEDSFSEFATALPAGFVPENPKSEKRPDPETAFPEKPCFKTPVPAKARSKRTRTGGRVWSLGSPSLTECSSSSSSSSSSSLSNPWLIYPATQNQEPGEPVLSVEKPPKKPKRRLVDGSSSQPPRRCSHCGVKKPLSGEPAQTEPRPSVTLAGSGTSRDGSCRSTVPHAARRFRASCTPTTTAKF